MREFALTALLENFTYLVIEKVKKGKTTYKNQGAKVTISEAKLYGRKSSSAARNILWADLVFPASITSQADLLSSASSGPFYYYGNSENKDPRSHVKWLGNPIGKNYLSKHSLSPPVKDGSGNVTNPFTGFPNQYEKNRDATRWRQDGDLEIFEAQEVTVTDSRRPGKSTLSARVEIPKVYTHKVSTSFRPYQGKIFSLAELAGISRYNHGATLNLVDYSTNPADNGYFNPHDDASIPSGTLDPKDLSTFNGGDRTFLNFVTLAWNADGTPDTTTKFVSYPAAGKQYSITGAINPNTTKKKLLKFLFQNMPLTPGKTVPAGATEEQRKKLLGYIDDEKLDDFLKGWPSITGSDKQLTIDGIFEKDDAGKWQHQVNSPIYGYLFSRQNPDTLIGKASGITELERAVMTVNSMRLMSNRYSYFTILTAVELNYNDSNSTTSSSYSFVRRDNTSGDYKIIRRSTK